jgi:hypothetical protein
MRRNHPRLAARRMRGQTRAASRADRRDARSSLAIASKLRILATTGSRVCPHLRQFSPRRSEIGPLAIGNDHTRQIRPQLLRRLQSGYRLKSPHKRTLNAQRPEGNFGHSEIIRRATQAPWTDSSKTANGSFAPTAVIPAGLSLRICRPWSERSAQSVPMLLPEVLAFAGLVGILPSGRTAIPRQWFKPKNISAIP